MVRRNSDHNLHVILEHLDNFLLSSFTFYVKYKLLPNECKFHLILASISSLYTRICSSSSFRNNDWFYVVGSIVVPSF